MKNPFVWLGAGMALLILVAAAGLALYMHSATAPPDAAALAALRPSDAVDVASEGWITFTPRGEYPTSGLILYPGGFVDPRAYAPVAHAIAAEGYLVVIAPMPLNLAVLGASRADDIIAGYPGVQRWAIGGHSLGGAMAAQYVARHPGAADALVLWAAYPPDGANLSGLDLAATSVFGTRDGLVSQAEIDGSRRRLPPDTQFVAIEGGNHAQFGSYGPQKGDLPAEISAKDQQTQAAAATVAVLQSMSP